MDHILRCKTVSSLRQGSYYVNLAQCQDYNRHFPSISSTELKWSILDSKGRAHIKDKMCFFFLSGCVGHIVMPLGLKSWLLDTFESLIHKWPCVLESLMEIHLIALVTKPIFLSCIFESSMAQCPPFPWAGGHPTEQKYVHQTHMTSRCVHTDMCEALSPSHHHSRHPSNKWLDESIT